ncbi:MAG: gliding motility-associated C-terminal domain-containing protein [Bacteroidetes bacterium]|nr:gliding motility-associated C-terminal domain-containing protein [Bacteroidota bacterium]
MNRAFAQSLIVIVFFWMGESLNVSAQTILLNSGKDTTLPCGVNCLNLSATLSNISNSTSYTLDSSLPYSGHYAYTGGSTTGIPIIDDKFSSLINLPFSFCFYGVNYSQIVISTNGHISFDVTKANQTSYWGVSPTIPTSTTSSYGTYYEPPSILPAFHDLYNPVGGVINYFTSGTAPTRKFIVNWSQVPQYSCTTTYSTFQLVLYEGTNVIEFYLQDKPFCSASTSNGKAICGIFGSSTQAYAVPGKNATQWGSTGMNKAYRFTPSGTSPTVQLLSATGSTIATAATSLVSGNPSLLTATFPNVCLTTDSAYYIAKVVYACSNLSVSDTIKVKRLPVPPSPTKTSPVNYCQFDIAVPLSATGQNILWYTTATGGTGSSTTPTPTTTNVGTQKFYLTQTINGCESNRDSIVVNIAPKPIPNATSNSPVCQGDTLKLFSTPFSGASYTWIGPNAFTSALSSPIILNAQPNQSGTYKITTTIGNCSTSDSLIALINPKPVITTVIGTNPTSCGGNNGTITISGLTTGTTYTVNYTKNSIPQGPITFVASAGTIILPGLTAGTYANISVTLNGCTTQYANSIALTDPSAPLPPIVSNNGPLCAGSTLNLNALPVSNATYSWSGPNGFSSLIQNPSITNAQVVNAGVYSVSITVNNCTSSGATTTVIVNPVPTITGLIGVNPSTCLGANGSIQLSGLLPNSTYTIQYSKNGIAQTPIVVISNASGIATIANLTAGTFTSITATANNCTSTSVGPVTLVDPLPPNAPILMSNSPICVGDTLRLNATASAGVNYSWTGPNSFSSNLQNPIIPNATILTAGTYSAYVTANNCTSSLASIVIVVHLIPATPIISTNSPLCEGNTLTLNANNVSGAGYTWIGPNNFSSINQNPTIVSATTAAGGTYTLTTVVNGCTSLPATTLVVVHPKPVITSITFTDPTTCGGNDGSITILGLSNSTTYTINYQKNGIATTLTATSSATGTLTISNLSSATYSVITVTLNGCTSLSAGPIVLSNPPNPLPPNVSSNSPLCSGATLNLLASNISGATYNWVGPNSFSSTSQNPTLVNVSTLQAGIYAVTVTVNNCISTSATTNVIIHPTPVIASTTLINPTTCGGMDGSITLNGLIPNQVYTISYSFNGGSTIVITLTASSTGTVQISGLSSGIYSNLIVTANGCNSAPLTSITLSNPLPPAAPIAGSNSPICTGNPINLTASSIAGAIYSWTGPNNFSSSSQNPVIANAQIIHSGIYSVSATVNNCTSVVSTVSVVINPTPIISNFSSTNPTSCGGSNGTITLTGLPSNQALTISYSKNGGMPIVVSQTSTGTGVVVILGLTAGVYSNIQVTINGCQSNTIGPITLSDPSSPAAPTISSNSPLCQGSTLLLNTPAVAGATYNWSGPSNFNSSNQNPSINNCTIANSGVYNLSVTVNGCTSPTTNLTVIVNPLPTISTTSFANPTTCGGTNGTITLNGLLPNSNYTLSYTLNTVVSTLSVTSSATGSVVIINLGAGVYSSISLSANGCSSSSVGPITLSNPSPPNAPIVTSNSPICVGNTLQLNAASPSATTYTWTGPNGFNSTTQNPIIANVQSINSGTYSVTATANNCVSASSNTTVVVNPIPSVPIVSNMTYCQFDTAFPLTAIGQNILWYSVSTGGIGSIIAPTVNTAIPGVTTWYVSQMVNGCESPRTPLVATVKPQPSVPTVITPINYCEGEVATPLSATGQNLLWYTTLKGGIGNSISPIPPTTSAGNFTYFVSQTINGCESPRATISVAISAAPPAPIVTATIQYCKGDLAQPLTAQGQNLLWYNSSVGGVGQPIAPTPGTTQIGTFDYYVSQSPGACESPRAHIQVVIYKPVQALIFAPTTVCQFDTVIILADSNNISATYSWNFDGGIVLSGSGAGPYQVIWKNIGTKNIQLVVTNGVCSAKANGNVYVRQSPDAIIEVKQDACIDEVISVRSVGSNSGGALFYWTFNHADVLSGTGFGPYKIQWHSSGVYSIQLQVSRDGCRSEVQSTTVNVHNYPIAQINPPNRNGLCAGDTLTLTATENPQTVQYIWLPEQWFTLNGRAEETGTIFNTGIVQLRVTDLFGCSNTDSILVQTKPCCTIALPEAFTPNGDGKNDVFRIITQGHHQLHSFRIFNRWGQIVFHTTDERAGWDGTFNGVPQEVGTYFYYLRYSCDRDDKIEKKGELTLLR